MAAETGRTAGRLPDEWAAELERAGGSFDARLDRFLARFHGEIVAARALKEEIDAGNAPAGASEDFRRRMTDIRALLAGEGKDFVEGLERRDPTLGTVAGANTLELAHGIERLESAVRAEEASRRRRLDPREKSFEVGHPLPHGPDGRTLPPGLPVTAAFPNLNSDETLQLMQSDIHALKLELMRLQRAKTAGIPLATSGVTPQGADPGNTGPTGSTLSMSSVSPESKGPASMTQIPGGTSGSLPPRSHAPTSSSSQNLRKMSGLAVTRVAGKPSSLAPSYVSHLEQMKSRLDALEKKPLSRTARRKSHARLGRTRTMGSLYDTPALSVALDENANPNVTAMTTPPRIVRKGDSASPASESTAGSLQSTPSPAGVRKHGAPGSRLFIDGPEELLKRPQSYAATRDMQRYSLKVARRFGQGDATHAPPAHVVEPRSKSAITHSPRKRLSGLGLPPPDHAQTLSSLANGGAAHPSTMDTTGSGGRVVEEMEGDMWVRKGVLWKRWRRRYASMVSHQFFGRVLCLFSYDASGGVNSARSQIIVLRDGLCRGLRGPVEVGGVERYSFVLRTAAKEYYFAADSDELRRNWVRELREAARAEGNRGVGSRLPTAPRSVFSSS